ncbi:hypothetical protein VTK56DRAFT_7956 [Thermocarpiscus australiensis]
MPNASNASNAEQLVYPQKLRARPIHKNGSLHENEQFCRIPTVGILGKFLWHCPWLRGAGLKIDESANRHQSGPTTANGSLQTLGTKKHGMCQHLGRGAFPRHLKGTSTTSHRLPGTAPRVPVIIATMGVNDKVIHGWQGLLSGR